MQMIRTWFLWCLVFFSVGSATAGIWTSNEFVYKPSIGARGAGEKSTFDAGMDRVDARLAKETWVGDPNYGYTLQDAITAIGANQVTLRVPPGTYNIFASLTIPLNITLKVERGAVLAVATTKTLTINGGIEAGVYQVFSCTGTGKVVFAWNNTSVKEIYPEWWGAVSDDSTNCAPAINAALTAAPALGSAIVFSGYVYKINSTLTKTNFSNLVLRGKTLGLPRIKAGAAFIMLDLLGAAYNFRIENLCFDGDNVATGGIRLGYGAASVNIGWGKLNNLYIKKIAGIGLEANFIEWNEMRRLQVEYCTDYGIKFSGSIQNHLEAWVGDSRIDLGLESGSNGNIIYGVFENNATVTDYHLLIKASVGNQITGWWESCAAPNYAQVKIHDSAHNNTIHKAQFYSVNTGRDWIIIGDAADAAPTGLTHIGDCYFSPGVSAGKYHVNIVKGNSARIDRNWCSTLSGEIAVYENDVSTSVANTFIPRKEDSWLVADTNSYNISFKDHERVINLSSVGGELTPTLPDPAKHRGLRVMVRKSDSSANKVILSAAPYYIYGAGSTVFRLLSRSDYVEVISNGSIWEVIGCRVMQTASITPASVAANSTSAQTFTFTGIYADNVALVKQPAQTSGIIAVATRVTTTDTLEITFANVTTGALTPAAGSYTIAVIR